MTVKEVLSMSYDEFNALNEKELRKATKIMVDVANKRLVALAEKDLRSAAAWGYAKRSGGKFSTAKKTMNQLKAEYVRVKSFLESKTSTIRGAKEAERKIVKALESKGVEITDKKNVGNLFKMYDEIKERDSKTAERGMKYAVITYLQQQVDENPQLSDKELINKVLANREDIYKEQKEREAEHFESASAYMNYEPEEESLVKEVRSAIREAIYYAKNKTEYEENNE